MAIQFSNNGATTTVGNIDDVVTSITVTDASSFPDVSGADDYCYATLAAACADMLTEIVKVTSITGNVLTVVRGQDNTIGSAWPSGACIQVRLNVAGINGIVEDSDLDWNTSGTINGTDVKMAQRMVSTGLRTGGLITINVDPTKIDIAAGTGQVIDNYTDPDNPAFVDVSWGAFAAVTDTGIGSGPLTYIGIDSAGVVQLSVTSWTPEQRRDIIVIGATLHLGASISAIIDYTNILPNDVGQTVQDLAETMAPMRSHGIFPSPNSGLTFSLSEGEYVGIAYQGVVDKKSPNTVPVAAQDPVTFLTTYKDGAGDWSVGAPTTTLPVGFYDDGSGTLAAIPATHWVIHRLYSTSTSNVIQYGQTYYTSHTEAIHSIQTENFELNPVLDRSLHVGYFIVRQDCIDISDTECGLILYTGTFRNSLAGSATTLPTNVFKQAQIDAGDPTGYIDISESTISFDNGTRTFSIAPVTTKFDYYILGQKYRQTTTKSIVIPDTEGIHLISFDGNDLRADLPGTITDKQLLSEFSFTALVYWDVTNQQYIFLGDERHGASMDWVTHLYLHNTLGTAYGSGLGIIVPTTAGTGANAEDAQISLADGVIYDEDIKIEITDGSPQTLAPIGQIPILYRDGLDASSIWRVKPADDYPMIYSGTAGYVGANGRLPYNELTGGSWTLTQVSVNDFVLVHIFATDDINTPIFGIQGQAIYGTAGAAREGANVEISQISTAGLPGQEFKAIGTIIYQTGSYANDPQARARPTDTGESYVDFRATSFIAASAATEHSSTTGRSNPNQHPASAIENIPSGSLIATDQQSVNDEISTRIDDLTFPDLADVPAYSGNAGKSAVVNDTEDGIEYVARQPQLIANLVVTVDYAGGGDYTSLQTAFDAVAPFNPGPYSITIDVLNIPSITDGSNFALSILGGSYAHITIDMGSDGTNPDGTDTIKYPTTGVTNLPARVFNYDATIAPKVVGKVNFQNQIVAFMYAAGSTAYFKNSVALYGSQGTNFTSSAAIHANALSLIDCSGSNLSGSYWGVKANNSSEVYAANIIAECGRGNLATNLSKISSINADFVNGTDGATPLVPPLSKQSGYTDNSNTSGSQTLAKNQTNTSGDEYSKTKNVIDKDGIIYV